MSSPLIRLRRFALGKSVKRVWAQTFLCELLDLNSIHSIPSHAIVRWLVWLRFAKVSGPSSVPETQVSTISSPHPPHSQSQDLQLYFITISLDLFPQNFIFLSVESESQSKLSLSRFMV
jgi:hypothetical protein